MSVYHPIFSQSDNADLASAIGDVILAWNAVEYDQVAMMAAMLGIPFDRASQLYHQIPNFRGRTQVLLALVGCTEGFEELKPFIAKYSKLSKTRNEIVHGAFIQQWGGNEIRRIKLNEPIGSERRSVQTKSSDIHQHANAVRAVFAEFREAGNAIPAYKAWLGPNPTET